MKLVDRSRRDRAAAAFALLAVASLLLVVAAATVPMKNELRSAMATAALVGYVSLAGRAMRIWQGYGHPSLHRRAWRRRFLDETVKSSVRRPHPRTGEPDCERSPAASASR